MIRLWKLKIIRTKMKCSFCFLVIHGPTSPGYNKFFSFIIKWQLDSMHFKVLTTEECFNFIWPLCFPLPLLPFSPLSFYPFFLKPKANSPCIYKHVVLILKPTQQCLFPLLCILSQPLVALCYCVIQWVVISHDSVALSFLSFSFLSRFASLSVFHSFLVAFLFLELVIVIVAMLSLPRTSCCMLCCQLMPFCFSLSLHSSFIPLFLSHFHPLFCCFLSQTGCAVVS